jgi:hypothetical protein
MHPRAPIISSRRSGPRRFPIRVFIWFPISPRNHRCRDRSHGRGFLSGFVNAINNFIESPEILAGIIDTAVSTRVPSRADPSTRQRARGQRGGPNFRPLSGVPIVIASIGGHRLRSRPRKGGLSLAWYAARAAPLAVSRRRVSLKSRTWLG